MTDISFLTNERLRLPFSAAATVGGWIVLSGEIGVRPDGSLAPGLAAQTRQTLSNIERTLARIDCTRAHIVKCVVILKDMSRWSEFNAAYLPFFDGGPLPVRSAFGTSGLAFDAEVEIECLAWRGDEG